MEKVKLLKLKMILLAFAAPLAFIAAPAALAASAPTASLQPGTAVAAARLGSGCDNKTKLQCLQNNSLVKYLNTIVDIMSAGVGIVVVGMIIVGGIQYSLAGDNSSAIQAAKKRIANALIALVAYALIFSFLQWILPGGAFNSP